MPNNQFKKGELYSFITGKASTAIARRLQKKFNTAGLSITIEQWSVLYQLWKQDGISQQEISDVLGRDKTTIARVISIMERDKMITRSTNKKDNRGKLIYLTTKGRSIQQKAVAVSGQLYMKAIEGLKEPQMKLAMRIMTAMTSNISKPSMP